jgi:long-chain acyl-CoA synthetase
MNVANLLARAARLFPDNPAVSSADRVWATYRELMQRVAAMGESFRCSLGLSPGDRVALVMRNCPEYVEIFYAAWYAGLTAVPVNCKLHPKEIEFVLADSGARACFADADLIEQVSALPTTVPTLERVIEAGSDEYVALRSAGAGEMHRATADDVAWLFYTSGTTGRPKGVMITHRNILCMTLCYFADVDSISPQDAILHAAPISHGSGLYNFPNVAHGANQVIPASGHLDPAEIFDLCRHWGGVSMFAAPTMVRRLVAHARRHAPALDGLRTVVYGGGPMYVADIRDALDVMGDRFVQIYGQGECPMTITALSRFHLSNRGHPRYEGRLASAGVAQSAVEVMVADGSDRRLASGEIGEVLVRSDAVMKGYWGNPEATAETLRHGWLHTGDMGSMDEDGFLTLHDRSKDLIISGGANIYPREVEEALLRHPLVSEVSVVGWPDPEWGEEVVAFVVARDGAAVSEAMLDAHCLEHIARFKRPKRYRFATELPKNNYGKVLKTELRARLRSESGL